MSASLTWWTSLQEEIGGVDQHGAVRRLGRDGEAPQHGLRKRLLHRELLGGVGGRAAKLLVRLHQQHLGADALEAHDAAVCDLSAVQAEIVRARAERQRVGVEKIDVEVRNLKVELAGGGVPVERKEAAMCFMPEVLAAMVGGGAETGAGLCASVRTGERTTTQSRILTRMDISTMRASPLVTPDRLADLRRLEL